MVPLAEALDPKAGLLSVRGKVLENGAPRFFRRLSEGVFDLADLAFRTHELADFVATASQVYGFDAARVTAIGYSNGANIAASLLFLRPDTVAEAVLLRAMTPFEPETHDPLSGKRVFLSEGRYDPIVPIETAERLAYLLRDRGADVVLEWNDVDHGLARSDIAAASAWLSRT